MFADTKGLIRSRKSNDTQYIGQKKKDNMTKHWSTLHYTENSRLSNRKIRYEWGKGPDCDYNKRNVYPVNVCSMFLHPSWSPTCNMIYNKKAFNYSISILSVYRNIVFILQCKKVQRKWRKFYRKNCLFNSFQVSPFSCACYKLCA